MQKKGKSKSFDTDASLYLPYTAYLIAALENLRTKNTCQNLARENKITYA